MVKQIFGAQSATACESAYRRLARIGAILGGFAVAAALPAPAAAQTLTSGPCVITGPGASFVPNLVSFGSGGSINTLVSAIDNANTAFVTQSTAFIGAPPPNPEPYQLGVGVWARGIGGQSGFKSTSTSTFSGSTNGTPLSANVSCNTKTKTNFAGVQIGTDIAQLNIDGWNLHGGATLGYVGATANDSASGLGLSDTLQIPFAGLYGAVTKGGLFADGQVRWSYYQNKVTDTSNGVFGQNLDARGFSVNANIGYNYALPDNWFIEPSAGVLWSKVSVDPADISGTAGLAQNPGIASPGTVSINNIYSNLGRISLRVGTSLNAAGLILQPFVTISGFREFVGHNSATFSAKPEPGFQLGGNLSATNIGNYGQFGLGVGAIIPNTGWAAYVRGDYRTGPAIDGWSMNGGLRYQLNPDHPVVTGRSADIPVTPVTLAAYDWTGFYLGPSLGADWGYTNWTLPIVRVFGNTNVGGFGNTYPRFAGVLPGGQVGYNYQYGKWVFGVEGDLGWTNAHGSRACPAIIPTFNFFLNCEIGVNFLATVTGRVGFAYWDRVLWYAKGGLAIGEVKAQIRCNTGSQPLSAATIPGGGVLDPACPVVGTSNTAAGWTVGGGSELALTDNWSVKAETSYFNLGTGHHTFGSFLSKVAIPSGFDVPSPLEADARRSGWIVNIGLNYRFTGLGEAPAVVAKY